MSAAILEENLILDQGSTLTNTLTIKDSAGVPIDLTGHSFSGMIRKSCADAAPVATFTCTILDQITNTGQMTFSLTPVQTAAIPTPGNTDYNRVSTIYTFDIEMTKPDTTKFRVIQGNIEVSPEATK